MTKLAFFNRSAVTRVLPAIILTLAACGKAKVVGEPAAPPPADAGFSLTIPQDRWAASRYCGEVAPETPEDPTPEVRFDNTLLTDKLAGEGLTGWIHGAVPTYKQYVFTYRKEDPTDVMAFFKAQQFSLVPATDAITATLAGLNRHDKVRLKGSIFPNNSPLTHLMVTGIEVLTKYPLATENEYAFDLAQLQGQDRFAVFGLVHATVASEEFGRAFVLEHDNLILPVAVPASLDAAAAKLYRGDIVNAVLKVVKHKQGPPHFELDAAAAPALQVIDPMQNCHGLEKTVTGYLVKFNKSPAISVDVYAVRVVDANGIGRNFTLFPDTEDEDQFGAIFQSVSDKAKAAWNAAPEEAQVVRNFWKKESIKVTVKGRLNVVSSEQANAQIYVKSADDVVSP